MGEPVNDVLLRTVRTFLETAGAYLLAHLTGVNFFEGNPGKTFWIGLALSTGAAGLAAAWNGVLAPLLKPDEETWAATERASHKAADKLEKNCDNYATMR